MSCKSPSAAPVPFEGREKMVIRHADSLMNLEFEPLVQPVQNLIVEGLTLLCGSPKVGKSWFVLALCCAVASGRPFLGRETTPGDVLYLALEDSDRRLQARLKALGESPAEHFASSSDDPLREACSFAYTTRAPQIDCGLIEELDDWRRHSKNPRLVIVDTLQKVRGIVSSRVNAYTMDYDAIGKLKDFADRHHIALVVVHHLNKMRDTADPFDRISGTNGLTGAADTTLILDRQRDSEDARLILSGRDVYGDDLHLRMYNGQWRVIGREAAEREAYENNYIVRTVKHLLKTGFGGLVQIQTAAFKEAIFEVCGNCPYGTVNAVSRAVSAAAPSMLAFDGITTERPTASGKRCLRFSYPQNKEVGQ